MTKSLFFFVVFGFILSTFAQNLTIDSLKTQLEYSGTSLEKAELCNKISTELKFFDPQDMLEFAQKALAISVENKFPLQEAEAYVNLGTANIILGNYEKSLEHFLEAKAIYETLDRSTENKDQINNGIAITYGYIGIVFSEQSNYTKAIDYYLKSVKIYEDTKNDIQIAKIYNNIGVAYQSLEDEDKALEYFLKSLELQQEFDTPNLGITQTNIANIYCHKRELDSAFAFYIDAKKSIERHPNPRALGEWFNNMGLFYDYKDQKQMALENWDKAVEAFQSIDDKFGLTDTYYFLARFYFAEKDYQKALGFAEQSLELSRDIAVLEQQSLSEMLISRIYEEQNNAGQALIHFKAHKSLSDSLTKVNDTRQSIESAMTYEFEKRELLQKEENEKRELLLKQEAKNSQLKLFLGGLILLLSLGIAFLIYNRNTLKKTLTLEKELAEYEQKALHLQMNPHFVFNCLGSISSFIVQNGTDSAIKYLSKFSKLMRLTLEYSKESLIPIDKEIESLDNYLQLEQLRFENKFEFSITKHPDVEDDVALPPLLIQPFIENAIIHGIMPKKDMGSISIDFSVKNETLVCEIIDNGIGIEASLHNKENSVLAHKSMALDIVKKRLEMIAETTSKNASIHIEDLKNNKTKGTKVILELPLRYINE